MDLSHYNPQPQMGFVKHAFTLAFFCLLRSEDISVDQIFEHSMEQTAMLAGDTDTNCAIVGGLVGAYCGIDNIAKDRVRKVLECNHAQSKTKVRPDFVKP